MKLHNLKDRQKRGTPPGAVCGNRENAEEISPMC